VIPGVGRRAELVGVHLKPFVVTPHVIEVRGGGKAFLRHLPGGVVKHRVGISARHAVAQIAAEAAQTTIGPIAVTGRTRGKIGLPGYMAGESQLREIRLYLTVNKQKGC